MSYSTDSSASDTESDDSLQKPNIKLETPPPAPKSKRVYTKKVRTEAEEAEFKAKRLEILAKARIKRAESQSNKKQEFEQLKKEKAKSEKVKKEKKPKETVVNNYYYGDKKEDKPVKPRPTQLAPVKKLIFV